METGDIYGGFNQALGVVFDDITADRCVARIEIGPRHLQAYGIVHGGVYTGLIEVTASMPAAVWAAERGMPGAVGVNNNTDFIKAIREGTIVATALPVHRGRSQQIWVVEVRDEAEDRLRARGQVRLQNIMNPDTVGSTERS